MSQHDFTIANQTASSARSDINNGLQALASNNSGASAPSTTYANMWWYDTSSNLLKIRNEGDSAWLNVAYVNQSTNKFEILDDTKVVTTSGSQAGLLGDQSTSTWQTGTGTTESLVSPAKIKAAVDAIGYTQPTTFDAVGTYCLGYYTGLGIHNGGATFSGSSIRTANTFAGGAGSSGASTSALTGTWRLMGNIGYFNNGSSISNENVSSTLFLRIS